MPLPKQNEQHGSYVGFRRNEPFHHIDFLKHLEKNLCQASLGLIVTDLLSIGPPADIVVGRLLLSNRQHFSLGYSTLYASFYQYVSDPVCCGASVAHLSRVSGTSSNSFSKSQLGSDWEMQTHKSSSSSSLVSDNVSETAAL